MDEHEWLAEQFEANRTHLQAVAYVTRGKIVEINVAADPERLRQLRPSVLGD